MWRKATYMKPPDRRHAAANDRAGEPRPYSSSSWPGFLAFAMMPWATLDGTMS